MPMLIEKPSRIQAAGNKPKLIDEYIGHVNSGEATISIAHMQSPAGWIEPGQTPEFDEYTVVLRGVLRVESRDGALDVRTGQAVVVRRGEWVRYSTPGQEGAGLNLTHPHRTYRVTTVCISIPASYPPAVSVIVR